MRKILIAASILLTILASNSCVKAKLEETYNKQEEQIDSYITAQRSKDTTYTVSYNDGAARLTKIQGTGEELSENGSVSFYYAGYTFSGSSISNSNMFVTNHQATAETSGWLLSDTDYTPLKIKMAEEDLLRGVKNGLLGVKAGEECEILFSGKYAFGNKRFGMIPAKTALAFKIWVIEVSNE